MLRAAVLFFLIAIVALIFGMNNIAGVSMELGKLLLGIFLVLAVVSFLASVISGGRRSRL